VKSDGSGKYRETRVSECTAVLTVSYVWGCDKQQGRQDNLKLHENEYKQNNMTTAQIFKHK